MLIPIPPIYRPRRRRPRPRKFAPTPPPPPQALTLTAADFDLGALELTLTFDRAVDLAAFQPGEISVSVGTQNTIYGGTGGTLSGPATVVVNVAAVGSGAIPGTRLTASGGTGIVAGDDGGTWEGVANLILPFG